MRQHNRWRMTVARQIVGQPQECADDDAVGTAVVEEAKTPDFSSNNTFAGLPTTVESRTLAFGHVSSGMELIRKMWALKTQGPPGSSGGELIASPVRILGARRV